MAETAPTVPFPAPGRSPLEERLDRLADQVARLVTILEKTAAPAADEFLDADGLAALLKCSVRSVRTWSATGELPKPTRLGRKRGWWKSAALSHLERQQKRR